MRATRAHVPGVVSGGSEKAWQAVMVARKALTVAAVAVSDPCFSAEATWRERVKQFNKADRDWASAMRAYRLACQVEQEAAA